MNEDQVRDAIRGGFSRFGPMLAGEGDWDDSELNDALGILEYRQGAQYFARNFLQPLIKDEQALSRGGGFAIQEALLDFLGSGTDVDDAELRAMEEMPDRMVR
jgi:hypothetical protein